MHDINLQCPNCKSDDKDQMELINIDRHTKDKVYFCNNCSKIFRIQDAIPKVKP